jgi:chromosome segregation ATPase
MSAKSTLAEAIARMAERIRFLEATVRELRDALEVATTDLREAETLVIDLRQENAELRQQLDLVTDREREGRGWAS